MENSRKGPQSVNYNSEKVSALLQGFPNLQDLSEFLHRRLLNPTIPDHERKSLQNCLKELRLIGLQLRRRDAIENCLHELKLISSELDKQRAA